MTPDRLRRLAPVAVLLGCFAVCAATQWMVWDWFIEDSAISFAYARHLAAGEGLVPWPGGERVEGYSNPLWVLLLACGEIAGFSGFESAKLLALGFSGFALVASWQVARQLLPEDGREGWSLLAPALLCTHSVFNMWAGSGLENALFGAVLLGALWRQLVERDGRRPWSALLWLALALTRPEGLLYAAAAGALYVVHTWRSGRSMTRVVEWVALFWIPGAALLAARVAYFAWPLPMTYYGKVGTGAPQLLGWKSRGWVQVGTYATSLWELYWIPVYLLGLLGSGRRGAVGALVGLLGLLGAAWLEQPVGVMAVLGALGLGALADRERWGHALLWTMLCISVLFPAYSNGDWMRGYRWMSLLAPSATVLLALGLREAVEGIRPRLDVRWSGFVALALPGLFLAALWVPKNYENSVWFAAEGKNESPHRIRNRVRYTAGVWEALFRDEQLVNMDMDMGAYLWWSDQWMVDMAGLVDVPIALHSYADRAFIEEYVTKERRPHLVHVHGHWERTSELPAYSLFARDWFEMPPWLDRGVRMHPGEYLRRDLIFDPSWDGQEGREVRFATGVRLRGWATPSAPISRGRAFFLEVGVQTTQRIPGREFRLVAFLAREGRVGAVWDLPMTEDRLPMDRWRAHEVFHGRYALEVPGDLPMGSWDLGFAAIGPGGRVLPAEGERAVETPWFAAGEARFPDAVKVVKFARADLQAESRLMEALEAADAGLCTRSEELWREGWLAVPKHTGWREENRPVIGASLARCWADEAGQLTGEEQVAALERARSWSHGNRTLEEVATPVAERLYAEGLAARAAEDWETAYRRFSDVLRVQPWRAWARRHAEEARNHRLGLGPLPLFGRAKRPEKTAPPP